MTAIVSPTGELTAALEADTDGVLAGSVAFRQERRAIWPAETGGLPQPL